MTDGETILRADGITKSFGRHTVLQGVSLEMHRGEIAGIIGENGTGKSTLLKILVGLLVPDSGSVVSDGLIGFCPQETVLFEALTVHENFQYFATAYGLSNEISAWQDEKNSLLEHFGFAEYETRLVSQLSGGTKQKLNLALALLHSPDILILDEPYSGFDWETYLRFWEYTDELRQHGKSVLIVSHLVNDRSKFDAIYDLKDGTLKCA